MNEPDLNTYPAPDKDGWTMARWWESTPLDNYQHAIEALEANPTQENYETSLKAHLECISYDLHRTPWYARERRRRRFARLEHRHTIIGNRVEGGRPFRMPSAAQALARLFRPGL